MPAITDERVERDFMITTPPSKIKHKAFQCLVFLLLLSCSQDLTDDPIPFATFADKNILLSTFPSLLNDGGFVDLSSQQIDPDARNLGVKGIILYRKNAATFFAIEKNCSYQPASACATVEVHQSTLFLIDPCCGSNFSFEGIPTGGVAWRPLRLYQTFIDGNNLTITDEVIQ